MKPNNNLRDCITIFLWIWAENLSSKNEDVFILKGTSTYKLGVQFKAPSAKNGIQNHTRCSGSL